MTIQVILGTMTFGWPRASNTVDDTVAGKMLDNFFNAGFTDLDTALVYSDGKTEEMLGRLVCPGSDRFKRLGKMAGKAGPWEGPNMKGTGGLGKGKVRSKLETSLRSMNRDKLDLFYLHAPDAGTNIENTLAEVHELHKEGKFTEFGLSNFQAWEVAHIWHTCNAKGYVKPTVYQGMYNAITRDVERELIPCLRKLGMAFYVYNPLAGGILTGKHKKGDPPPGRFKENAMYLDRFWKENYFNAVDALAAACESEGITMTEASLRWLQSHSQMRKENGDAVIIGASNLDHLDANLKAMATTAPLSEKIVKAFDDAWLCAKTECPPYARGYSGSAL